MIWSGFTLEPLPNLRAWTSTFTFLQRLYAFFRRGYMQFAEAINIKIKNKNHLSPVDTEAGTELGKITKTTYDIYIRQFIPGDAKQ